MPRQTIVDPNMHVETAREPTSPDPDETKAARYEQLRAERSLTVADYGIAETGWRRRSAP